MHCALDVLATYKTEIGNTSAFVLYDTSGNTEIVDRRLSQITSATTTTSSATLGFVVVNFVMMRIVGDSSVNLWGVSASVASTLLNSIENWMDDPDILEIPDVSDFQDIFEAVAVLCHNITVGIRLLISTGKAPDCIKSALLLPLPVSAFSGSGGEIYLGAYPTNKSGTKISMSARAVENVSVSIPWQSSDWRRNDPYTKIYVGLPYIGTVTYPASQLIGASSIGVTYQITVNGAILAHVSANGHRLGTYSGNCASNYMVGASNINPLQGMGAIAAGGGAAAGVALASSGVGAAAVGAAGIVGMLNGAQSIPTCVGGTGGGANTDGWTVTCTVVYHNTNVEPASVAAAIGTPTMAVKTISSCSGFVQTREASVGAACYDDVRKEINSLMDGGFFYE